MTGHVVHLEPIWPLLSNFISWQRAIPLPVRARHRSPDPLTAQFQPTYHRSLIAALRPPPSSLRPVVRGLAILPPPFPDIRL
jgi:hypothetical protein